MAGTASHGRARLQFHLAPSPGRLERHGTAAPGPCRPGPDGARGTRGRSLGRGGRQLSVRAKRGGELTGPNPTDRGKAGTKYHAVVASADGLPLGVVPSAANVHDTRLFPHLLRLAQVVCAAIGRLYADAGYDSADNRGLCVREGIRPLIREVGQPHGSGLGAVRCVVEHDCAWLLANKRLDRRQDRLGRMILALLTAACIFIVANRIHAF